MVFAFPAMVNVFSTLVFDVEKMVLSLNHIFSPETIFRASEPGFSITEKTVGKAPAAFV
jgi:hypothetical protein